MPSLAVRQSGKDPLAEVVKAALKRTDGKLDKAVQIAADRLLSGLISPHADSIAKLVSEALRARMSAEHGADRAIALHNARDPANAISRASKRPVAVPFRRSNAELQAEIDETLDMRILGDVKLRDATRNDLFKSAEMDEKVSRTRAANAKWKRKLGMRLRGGQSIGEAGISGLEVRRYIRETGGTFEE